MPYIALLTGLTTLLLFCATTMFLMHNDNNPYGGRGATPPYNIIYTVEGVTPPYKGIGVLYLHIEGGMLLLHTEVYTLPYRGALGGVCMRWGIPPHHILTPSLCINS